MRAEEGHLGKEVEAPPPQDGDKREPLTKLSVDADNMLHEHQARLQKCLDTWSSRQEEMLTTWKSQLEKVEMVLSRHEHLQDKGSIQEKIATNSPQVFQVPNVPRRASLSLQTPTSSRKNSKRQSKITITSHHSRYSNFTANKFNEDALFERAKHRTSEAVGARPSTQAPQRQGSLLAPYSVVSGVPKVVDTLQPGSNNKKEKKAMSRIVSGIKASIRASVGLKQENSNGILTYSNSDITAEEDEKDDESLQVLTYPEYFRICIHSLWFDLWCGSLIFLNAALIGVETDFMVDRSQNEKGFFVLQMVFNVWYLLELTVRVWADRFRFFSSKDWKWNIFDMALVSISLIELLLEILNMRGFAVMGRLIRSIRILRVVRTLRIVRVLRYVREFRKMIFSIAASMQTLFWSLTLLGVMMYIFAVLFTQAVSQYKRDMEKNGLQEPADLADLQDAFGSLSRSTYSLYMAISGGKNWGLVANPLMILHWSFVFFFLTFITVCVFGVLNVVTSVFVESAMQSANHYRDLLIQEKMHDKEMYVKHMREVFKQIDADGNDEITFGEVEEFLQDSNLRMYLEALEIDLVETHSLFRLLDKDGSGSIDIDEFCEGCLRLKGDAKSFDIHCLLYENQRMLTKWSQFMEFVEAEFFHLHTGVRMSVVGGGAGRFSLDENLSGSRVVEEEEDGDVKLGARVSSDSGVNSGEGQDGCNPYRFYPQHPKSVPGRVVSEYT